MNRKIYPIFIAFCSIVLILFSFSSCSVKKRSYRKGYYIDYVFNKKNPSKEFPESARSAPIHAGAPIKETVKPVYRDAAKICSTENILLVSLEVKGKRGNFRIRPLPPDTCSDMIYLQDGTEFAATIIELTEEKVRYRRCDKNRMEILETGKDKILMVRFSNGKIESYNEERSEFKNPPTHPLAVLSFVSVLASIVFLGLGLFNFVFLFFAIAALLIATITAYSAKKQIMTNVGEYKGLRLLKASRIILTIVTIISLLLIFSLK